MQLFQNKSLEKKLFFFSIPLILSLVTQQLYGIVDMIIVGKYLGADELAAVGNASNIVILFIVVSGGIELAVEIIFSRYIGKKDEESIAKGAVNMLVFGCIVGIFLAVAGFFILPSLFEIMNIPAKLVGFVRTYSYIYMLGVPAIYMYDISRAMITSMGDSKKSFYLIFSSTILNILLDLVFILVFKMGVAGAAFATILAQILMMAVSCRLLYQKIRKNPYFTFKPSIQIDQLKEILHVALPSIFQQFVITVTSLFLQALVNPFGREIIIGYVAVTKISTITRLVVAAFSQTLSIYSAQMFAGKKYQELKRTYRFLVQVSLIYTAGVILVLLLFPEQLCSLFFDVSKHSAGYDFFRVYLHCSLISFAVCIFKFMNENLLRSALEMKEYLVCNIGDLLLRLAVTYALLSPLGTNVFWVGELLGRLFAVAVSFYYLRRLNQKIGQNVLV